LATSLRVVLGLKRGEAVSHVTVEGRNVSVCGEWGRVGKGGRWARTVVDFADVEFFAI
jgi:hypothetical protein